MRSLYLKRLGKTARALLTLLFIMVVILPTEFILSCEYVLVNIPNIKGVFMEIFNNNGIIGSIKEGFLYIKDIWNGKYD